MNSTVMFVRLSENCNAGCFMCYFAHEHGLYNITDEQFDSLIQYMNDKETYNLIRFTGREPLLHINLFNGFEIVNDFNAFQEQSDIILANRVDERLKNNKKVYTRDIYNVN